MVIWWGEINFPKGRQMKLLLIIFPLLLLSLVGCRPEENKFQPNRNMEELQETKNEDGNIDSSLKINKKRKTELKQDFSNFLIFKDDINTYKVSFKATRGHYSFATIVCSKFDFDRTKELITANFDESGINAKLELSLDDKDPLDVEFKCKVMDKDLEIDSGKIRLKKSIVVNGVKNPYPLGIGLGAIETLVFDEGAVLLTEGVHLNIEAKEIISRDGKIVTFTEESADKTFDDQHGLSGGMINILTDTGIGKVSVQLRGMNGGRQTKIPEPIKDAPARDETLNGSCKGPKNKFSNNDQRCFGKEGRQGYKGHKGFNGFHGGSTGAFFYKAKRKDDLKMKVVFFPGRASSGGAGGEGGQGGPGGIGSNLPTLDSYNCYGCDRNELKSIQDYGYPDGQQGRKGDNGDSGHPGKDGESENSSVEYMESNMKFNFNHNWQNL